MAVPAEATIDALPAHGLIPRHHVFDIAGEEVSMMRKAIGEGRSVIEDKFVGFRAGFDRISKCLFFDPTVKDVAFNCGKVWPIRHSGIVTVT